VNERLDRLGTWQFVLIVWPAGALCVMLGYGIPTWLSDSRFNLVLFVGLAVVTSLVGLPPMIWQQSRRRRVQSLAIYSPGPQRLLDIGGRTGGLTPTADINATGSARTTVDSGNG